MISLGTLRDQLGISQRQLAALLQMDYTTLCRIETGRRTITTQQLQKAEALALLVHQVLGSTAEPKPRATHQQAAAKELAAWRREWRVCKQWVDHWQPRLNAHAQQQSLLANMISHEQDYPLLDYALLRQLAQRQSLAYQGPEQEAIDAVVQRMIALQAGITALEAETNA